MKEHTSPRLLVTAPATPSHLPSDAPPDSQAQFTDAKASTNILIGWVLRSGVLLSASITLVGLLLLPLRPGGLSVQRMLTFPQTFSQEWMGLLMLHPQAIILLGIVLLITTPVLSVATSAVAFAQERDRLFVVISLIVLAILLTSFFLERGGV